MTGLARGRALGLALLLAGVFVFHARAQAQTPTPAQTPDCGAPAGSVARLQAVGEGPDAAPTVVFLPRPAPPAVGRHFNLVGQVCGPGAWRLLRVDADMPAHRHGMNYRPTVQMGEGGRFEAAGLLFHMPGRWRYRFEVEATAAGAGAEGGRRWLSAEVEVR